ncbi:hypothetical protein [Sphaerisporangium sp. TRM90804]|nr:hypothetical protein [Sphaerisporangium sp. TRM90804]
MIDRIKLYFRSPKGQQHVARAKTMARDPRNQQRLRQLMDRLRSRRTH